MNITKVICTYCRHDRPFGFGWHDCPEAQAAKALLEQRVNNINAMFEPDNKPRRLITK